VRVAVGVVVMRCADPMRAHMGNVGQSAVRNADPRQRQRLPKHGQNQYGNSGNDARSRASYLERSHPQSALIRAQVAAEIEPARARRASCEAPGAGSVA